VIGQSPDRPIGDLFVTAAVAKAAFRNDNSKKRARSMRWATGMRQTLVIAGEERECQRRRLHGASISYRRLREKCKLLAVRGRVSVASPSTACSLGFPSLTSAVARGPGRLGAGTRTGNVDPSCVYSTGGPVSPAAAPVW
jgi:hypothetical protein